MSHAPHQCHVISNTHWDREWRYPFQSYRMQLVEMMDGVLDLLQKRPDYRAFLLDSQTVILEDYFEIRPERADDVRRFASEDRLQIGPWYTLPDEWGCPGEALVRNLLLGHQVGEPYGPIFKVGYTPFSNGQISQMPQLYRGFRIDSIFFYRGIGKHVAPPEFHWQGPDGSTLLAFKFGDYARYNYYYQMYRPGLLGRFRDFRSYPWSPEEIPYHVATDQQQDRHYGYMALPLALHDENLERAIADTRDVTIPGTATPHLLYMMGHDHSFAAEQELDLINAANDHPAANGDRIFHSALNDYLQAFRAANPDLPTLRGEMRHVNKIGLWTNLMGHILSCRLYLKQRNADVCARVLYGSEPLAAAAWLAGMEYPAPFFLQAWKRLLVNHAHDAIGGCSVDQVHQEMLTRFNDVHTISDEISRRALVTLAGRLDASSLPPRAMQLTLFNPLPTERHEHVEMTIDIPHEMLDTPDGPEGALPFRLETSAGQPVSVQLLQRTHDDPTIEDPLELTMTFDVVRSRVLVAAQNLPPMGHDVLVAHAGWQTPLAPSPNPINMLENEHLAVEILPNGTARVTHKATGRVMENLGHLEDTAEFGDPWNRVTPEGEAPLTSLGAAATLKVLQDGPLLKAVEAVYTLELPAEKDPAAAVRSAATVPVPVRIVYALRAGSPTLDIDLTIENTARDHRMRLMIPTHASAANESFADGQFDILTRPIQVPPPDDYVEPPYPTHPMWNFAGVQDGTAGVAVINNGLIEYEAVDDAPRTLAITLFRGFGKFVFGRPVPGAQCLGTRRYRLSVYPFAGDWRGSELLALKDRHVAPVQVLQSAPTRGDLPLRRSLLALSPASLCFSTIKQGREPAEAVLRFWNTEDTPAEATITCGFDVSAARRLTLEEKEHGDLALDGNTIRLALGPKEIATVGIRPVSAGKGARP